MNSQPNFSISPTHPIIAEMTNPGNEKVYSVCTVVGAIDTPGAAHLNTSQSGQSGKPSSNTLVIHTSSDVSSRGDFQ